MNFKCKTRIFKEAFEIASSASAVRDAKAILQNVLVKCADNKITLTGINLQTSVETSVEAECFLECSFVLPKTLFQKILRENDDEEIDFSVNDDGAVTVFRGRYKNIPTQPAEDYPSFVFTKMKNYVEINGPNLLISLQRTMFSVDPDNHKYSLGGVYMEFSPDGTMDFVSTDGRKISNQKSTVLNVGEKLNSVIVPIQVLSILQKIVSGDNNVKISTDGGKVYFETNGKKIWSLIIEGRFPCWKKIFPDVSVLQKTSVVAGDFLKKLKQTSVVTTDLKPGVQFDFKEDGIEMTASGDSLGNASNFISVPNTGKEVIVSFTPEYICDFLSRIDPKKEVDVYYNEDKSVFTTDDGFRYAVMPLSIDRENSGGK